MKLFKKLLLGAAVTALAAGTLSTGSFAAGTHRIYGTAEKASVGDIITVKVNLDTEGTNVSAVGFDMTYDGTALEYIAPESGNTGAGSSVTSDKGFFVDITGKTNRVSLGIMSVSNALSKDNEELAVVQFKVLKIAADTKIDLVLDAVSFIDDNGAIDLTNQYSAQSIAIQCSHKNTEIKTEIEDCENGGKTVTECKDCGEAVKSVDIAPAEHKIDSWTETLKATCTAKGEEEGVCTVCGKTFTRETETVDHSFGEWAVVKAASCTEKGTEERTCSRCDEKETRETDKIDHTVEWKVTKEADCTEDGERTGICSVCGQEATEAIPAEGHSFGEWKTVKEATETEKGIEERECGACGEKESRDIPLKPKPSDPGSDIIITEDYSEAATSAPESSESAVTPAPEKSDSTTAPAPESSKSTSAPAPETDAGASTAAPASGTGAATAAPDADADKPVDKDSNVATGAGGIAAVAGLAAITAAAVIITKKRK